MFGKIFDIICYPVKGLPAMHLQKVQCQKNKAMPGDRMFAIEKKDTGFNEINPQPISEKGLLQHKDFTGLADHQGHFDFATGTYTLYKDRSVVLRSNLSHPAGCTLLQDYLNDILAQNHGYTLRILTGAPLQFTYDFKPFLSLVNLASIDEASKLTGKSIDLSDIRPNLLMMSDEPWTELTALGQTIEIGDTVVEVVEPMHLLTETEGTQLDLDFNDSNSSDSEKILLHPKAKPLKTMSCGVYLKVLQTGTLKIGDTLRHGQVSYKYYN